MSALSFALPRHTATIAGLCLSGLLAIYAFPAKAESAGPAETHSSRTADCSCPDTSEKKSKPKLAGLAGAKNPLDENDEIATLIGIQTALGTAADGSPYVWHRHNGRISSMIKPTSTFRNGSGALCRHIVLMLTTGHKTRKMEGTACRHKDGRWHLDG